MSHTQKIAFEEYSERVAVNNTANTHICNNKKYFIGKINSVNEIGVVTIEGTDFKPSGTEMVKW